MHHFRIFLSTILFFTSGVLIAQSGLNVQLPSTIKFKEPIEVEATEKLGDSIKVGEKMKIKEMIFYKSTDDSKPIVYLNFTKYADGQKSLPIKYFNKFVYTKWTSSEQAWNSILIDKEISKGFLFNINSKAGFQYDLRNDMFIESNEYLDKLIQSDRIFKDDYFEDYLYSLVTKIHPGVLSDGRPGNISIKILKNTEPNAFCLANGTILVTTGLLSTIESEDELIAILTHEIAHFVLDHAVSNYNMEADRKKKAEFWAVFATAVATTADIYMSSNNKNHPTGLLTYSVAVASAVISNEVLKKLGLKYSREQELEADQAARQILNVLNYNKFALDVALKRIKYHNIITGNYMALSGSGSHPNIDERIDAESNQIDEAKFTKQEYLSKVSFINSYNAEIELYYSHHLKALGLVDKNIKSNIATETDYIVKASILRRLYNSKEKMDEVLGLLTKAKSLNVTKDIILNKEEGITLSRIGRNIEAKKSFDLYLLGLNELLKKDDKNSLINDEIEWARKMIFKVSQIGDNVGK
ncbi:M48 family metallopeptidase [Aquirufa echingensis]|uniref:M48 family metallopeptidase n=1 Tax=Aquirufa echingensis TaxID=3096516 RepID=A0ABW6CWQ7_9BACT